MKKIDYYFSEEPTASDRSIISKVFLHRGLRYPFNWAKYPKHTIRNRNSEASLKLWRYLNDIVREKFPKHWFDDYGIKRISSFKLAYLKRGTVPKIGNLLIEEGYIEELHNHILIRLTNDMYEMFYAAGILDYRKPSHEEVLKAILLEDADALATEVPVWIGKPEPVTGHIDLIRVTDNDTVQIADFKPEKNFARALPQISVYALILQKKLGIKVKCIMFNRHKAWIYEPLVTMHRVIEILDELGCKHFDWEKYIRIIEHPK